MGKKKINKLMLLFNDPPIDLYLPTNSLLIYAKLLNLTVDNLTA